MPPSRLVAATSLLPLSHLVAAAFPPRCCCCYSFPPLRRCYFPASSLLLFLPALSPLPLFLLASLPFLHASSSLQPLL